MIGICQSRKPEMIIQLFKSGAKHPDGNLPGLDYKYGFERSKDLSEVGMRQMYNLGKTIRYNYPDLVVKDYDFFSYNLTASDRNRTHASAYSFLQGIHDQGKPLLVNTPNKEDNWMPPFFSQDFKAPVFTNNSALPNDLTLTPVRSFYLNRNFMFKANSYCPNLNNSVVQNIERLNKKFYHVFKESYEIFDEHGFEVYKMFDFADTEWNLVNLGMISQALTSKLYNFSDDPKILKSMPYELRAHMVLINSIMAYLPYDKNKYLNTFNSELFSSWIYKLSKFNKDFGEEEELTKVELYSGHITNISAVIQSLVNHNALFDLILKYKQFLFRPTIDSKDQFEEFISWLYTDLPYADLRFASNIVLEVNSLDGKDGKNNSKFNWKDSGSGYCITCPL